MKKIILILMIEMVLFNGIVQAIESASRREEITKSTETIKKVEPKLLWKKEFDGDIHSFTAYQNGSYIAVAINKSDLDSNIREAEIILLNANGKELWKKSGNWAVKGFGNKTPLVVTTNYRETRIFNEEGNLIWSQKVKGSPIISPDDKHITVFNDGTLGVPILTVFDTGGNRLWNYKPNNLFNVVFIDKDMIAIAIAPIRYWENEKIVQDASGKIIVFKVNNGEKVYEYSFEYLLDIGVINIEYDANKNELKIILGSYPPDAEIVVPLKTEIGNIKSQKKSFSSLFSVSEIDLPNVYIKKLNKNSIGFFSEE